MRPPRPLSDDRRRTEFYGVMLNDLSFTQGLLSSPAWYLSASPATRGCELVRRIRWLLLSNDFVHIPYGQLFTLPNRFMSLVADWVFKDDFIQLAVRNSLISTTHSRSGRQQRVSRLGDQLLRLEHPTATVSSSFVKDAALDMPFGLEFDNRRAAEAAYSDLYSDLAQVEHIVSKSGFAGLQANLDKTRDREGSFRVETFLTESQKSGEVPAADLAIATTLTHAAYFRRPNHLSQQQLNADRIKIGTARPIPTDASIAADGPALVEYLSSPEFLQVLLSRWMPKSELQRVPSMKAADLLEMRADSRWDDFVEYFHQTATPLFFEQMQRQLSLQLPENLFKQAEATGVIGDAAAGEVANHLALASAALKSVKFGGLVGLALRSHTVANVIENLQRAPIRDFVVLLRQYVRRVK